MLKKILLTIVLAIGLQGAAWADAVTKEEALKAIATFEQSPMGDESKEALGKITQFASESKDIMMTLRGGLLTWIIDGEDIPYMEQRATLLGAYFAGNVKSQINAGKAVDDPYSGLLQVLATYDQLRKADKNFKLAEVEEIKVMKEKGQLRAHIARASEQK